MMTGFSTGVGKAGLILAVALSVAGCERVKRATGQGAFSQDGIRFRERVQVDKADRAAFTVSVGRAERGIAGAKEAARVGATRHCIKFYGNSDITWDGQSPDDEEVALNERGDLVMSGRCTTW